jgi:rhamnose utilization protein RhaD (predicted bifunctional aldolase and dehydrogenase)
VKANTEVADAAAVEQIVILSRQLGDPGLDYVILAEGNTSIRTADGRMLVKASGVNMAGATAADFVPVGIDDLLEVIADPASDDVDVDRLFSAAQAAHGRGRPSVEALLHAVCLELPGVNAVGHTHPIAVNGILCSQDAALLTEGSLFPDQIVVLGTAPLLIDYVDPGLALARVVRQRLRAYTNEHGEAPKVIYLSNHGMFALGGTAAEVLRITAMAVKSARIMTSAAAFGGVRFMPDAEVTRIHTRSDELYRRRRLEISAVDSGAREAFHG